MSLPRLRLENCIKSDNLWHIDPEQAHHLVRVRRCYTGSLVEGLLDGVRVELKLVCEGANVDAVEVSREAEPALSPEIHLLLAVLKNDQFDDAIRFSAETGVHTIHLLAAARSVPKYEGKKLEEKMSRWRKILDESTKQAGAATAPVLVSPVPVMSISTQSLPDTRYAAILSSDAAALKSLPESEKLAVAIGPEGDWSPEEKEFLLKSGFSPISLGKRILRASTAVAAACSWFALNISEKE
ncbi:MAG: RsmE family RNA methyltransferase [Synergistaceae bacterium]